jgi:FkbM family methyltransferase
MKISNVVKHPGAYLRVLKFTIAGLIFDILLKRFRANGCSFVVPKDLTTRAGRGYFALDLYEKPERQLVTKYIQGDESVLELGACIGIVSCIVNKRLQRPVQHVVVEANPSLIPWLEENKKSNECSFAVESCIVSNKKEDYFYFGQSIVSGSLLQGAAGTATRTKVQGKSFDEIQRSHNIKFDTLIMDIEGGEHEFLTQNKSISTQLNLLIIENHPHILSQKQIDEYEALLLASGLVVAETVDTTKVWLRPQRNSL